MNLLREFYWSKLRSSLYNRIVRETNYKGFYEWEYICGRKTRDNKGNKIVLSNDTINILNSCVEYFNTTEGIDDLIDLEILNPPEHYDDLISIIQEAKNDKEMKKIIFNLFRKNQSKLLKYLDR